MKSLKLIAEIVNIKPYENLREILGDNLGSKIYELIMATKLDLADAQFIGFHHGKWNNHDITGLVESMGLTKKEWVKWKKDYPHSSLTESEIQEIDEHFQAIEQNDTRYTREAGLHQ